MSTSRLEIFSFRILRVFPLCLLASWMVVEKFNNILIPGSFYMTCILFFPLSLSQKTFWNLFIPQYISWCTFSFTVLSPQAPVNLEIHSFWFPSVLVMFCLFELDLFDWLSDFLIFTFCHLTLLSK